MYKTLTFNGVRKEWLYLREGRQKAPFAPISRSIKAMRKGHRVKRNQTELLKIIQPIGYKYFSDEDALTKKDELAEWLITEDIAPLTFDDEPGRTYWSIVENSIDDLTRQSYTREGTIQFLCLYTTGDSKTINITDQLISHNITGQKETPWTSKTIFTVPQSQFILESNKGRIILNYNFIAGDILGIEYKTRSIFLNGNNIDVAITLDSIWFELEVGVMQFKSSHPTELKYTERYH